MFSGSRERVRWEQMGQASNTLVRNWSNAEKGKSKNMPRIVVSLKFSLVTVFFQKMSLFTTVTKWQGTRYCCNFYYFSNAIDINYNILYLWNQPVSSKLNALHSLRFQRLSNDVLISFLWNNFENKQSTFPGYNMLHWNRIFRIWSPVEMAW